MSLKVSIFEQAVKLEPVSEEAATRYAENSMEMVCREDECMKALPNLQELLGGRPLEVMFDNHRNHARFMSNVFRFNHYRLMARIVVWVYRSYHARGFSFEYFRQALPYWQQAVRESLPQREAGEINRVYQWLLDHHGDFIELAQNREYEIFSMNSDREDLEKAFLALLLEGNFLACSALAAEIVQAPSELADFYLQILQPCMVEVGNLWEGGAVSIAQEHLATAVAHQVLASLYAKHLIGIPSKGKAIITASENEMHDVGARIVADMLEMDGWEVAYLGANTPRADLLQMMRELKPEVLGLSVVVPFNLEAAGVTIAEIRKDEALKATRIIVGGPAFRFAPDLWLAMGADGFAADGAAAVLLACGGGDKG